MTPVTLRQLLEEIETAPTNTELVDIEQLLVAAGYERKIGDKGLILFVHYGWGSRWTLDSTRRYIPVSIVLAIAAVIRERSTAERRL